jgi:hypothetical protein
MTRRGETQNGVPAPNLTLSPNLNGTAKFHLAIRGESVLISNGCCRPTRLQSTSKLVAAPANSVGRLSFQK